MKNNFIEITDNVSDTYYINIDSVAYLKEGVGTANSRPIYKIVLVNDKQVIITNISDFTRIKDTLHGKTESV